MVTRVLQFALLLLLVETIASRDHFNRRTNSHRSHGHGQHRRRCQLLDNVDGTIEPVATSTVDTSEAATYTVTYNVSDAADNPATAVTRTVLVEDWSPVLGVIGDSPISFDQGTELQDPGGEAINLPFNPVLYLPFNGNSLDHSPKLGNQDADLRGDANL